MAGASDLSSRQRELRRALALAMVPASVALVFGLLLLPRQPLPDSVPLPVADVRALASAEAADIELAHRTQGEPLPPTVRALGSALRDFHTREANGADVRALSEARHAIDLALVDALAAGNDALLRLRAVELQLFVVEIGRFEATGVESDELKAVAGDFVRSMRNEGWIEGHRLAAAAPARRALYKQMWSAFLGLDARAPFALSLDESRSLYALYLLRPHASPGMREAIAAARRGARNPRACRVVDEAERVAVEGWRIDRIARLAAIDPLYPAAYARGVANLRRGDHAAAASAFREWLAAHADGPLALRAQNYLRSAVASQNVD